jgi:hypothetical protein
MRSVNCVSDRDGALCVRARHECWGLRSQQDGLGACARAVRVRRLVGFAAQRGFATGNEISRKLVRRGIVEAQPRCRLRDQPQTVTCTRKSKDQYGREVAVCAAGGQDLNRWLVENGLAVAYRWAGRARVRVRAGCGVQVGRQG